MIRFGDTIVNRRRMQLRRGSPQHPLRSYPVRRLLAARTLQAAGWHVAVIDKGRGVGGRMATRRIEAGTFDHGAQFLTARDRQFQSLVDEWVRGGIVKVWARGFSGPSGKSPGNGHPRYIGAPGMTAVPKALAAGLPITLQQRG